MVAYPILLRTIGYLGIFILIPGIIIGAATCLAMWLQSGRWRTGPALLLVAGAAVAPYLTLGIDAIADTVWQPYMPILFGAVMSGAVWWGHGG